MISTALEFRFDKASTVYRAIQFWHVRDFDRTGTYDTGCYAEYAYS